jgi:PAS domain S-box-containing protein
MPFLRRGAEVADDGEARFQAIADAAPVMIWMADASKACTWFNEPWLQFTGRGLQEHIGDGWMHDVHPDDLATCVSTYHGAFDRRQRLRNGYRLRRADGTWRIVEDIGVPRFSPTGEFLGYVGACVDVTDQRAAEQALQRSEEQLRLARAAEARVREREEHLRDADRRKDEFIATLSHELRNPLAPLASALSVARMSDVAGSQTAQMHEMMERQLDHLVRLVDDLLEVSRVSHGVMELRRAPVELAAIVRNAVETSRTVIDAAAHELDVSLPQESVWLDGDAVRLEQVLANLLNNAARFMAPGGRIDLHATADARWIEVVVRDQGSGFERGCGERLFRMFGAGKGSGGLGIGLALARKLVQMHGGSIEATSEGPGQGARFTLRLPRIAAPSASVAPESAMDLDEVSIAGKRILVVDDNRDAAESLRMMLELLGADVRVAYNGRDAIARFAEYQPAAMLLDIGMPGMDGYEVAREIRARADGTTALIVALTGWGQEDDRRQSREAGFDHHLVKPADLETLERVLASTRGRGASVAAPSLQ